jgi:glycosyltransferase involved in cell wall biosynthesis
MQNPSVSLVSVVIATYNSARFIGQALKSVLSQTYDRYEVIVVDDGSTDNTQEVLREFEAWIQYLYQENHGPSAARNAGIRLAKGDYICFLDADDQWSPNKLESQLAFLEDHSNIGLVFSDEEEISTPGTMRHSLLASSSFYSDLIDQTPLHDAFRKLLIENFIPTSTVMVRKACFATAGLFDESLRVVEDRDLWLRMAAHFEIACLPLVLGKKLEHEANISTNSELNLRSRIKVWRKMRRLYPNLTPVAIISGLMAEAYLQLGYILAAKEQRKEARQAGISSLTCAIRRTLMNGSADVPLPAYNWSLGLGLLPLTLLGWSRTRSLRRFTTSLLWKS